MIQSKEIKLLDLVKALGDYLTADDDLLRPKATDCLSQTLAHLSKDTLSRNDIQVLIGFYISKLDDVKSTKETLLGINHLILMEQFPQPNIKTILDTLHDQYQSNQHLASTRFLTFDILDNLIIAYPEQVKRFQKSFIKTFIHIASSEKDPKNLLKSFSLNSKISLQLTTTRFEDDLFDVLFCYFPISFKPPKDDPYKITSDQLKSELRKAIASNPSFAEDSYPNLLEKLTSTSPVVKHDTIQTIHDCIETYGTESLESHYVELWNALKFEILHGNPDDDEDNLFPPILKIFTTITKVLSKSTTHFTKFLDSVQAELTKNIQRATPKMKQSCIILSSLASATPDAYNVIVQPTLTLLLKSQTLSIAQQRQVITNIGYFTTAYTVVFGTYNKEISSASENTLLSFKDELLIQLGKSLMSSSHVEVSLRTLAIAELTKLTTLLDFLAPSELSLIVQYFTETVLVDDNQYVYGAGIAGLIQVGEIDNTVLIEVTYPLVLGSLLPNAGEKEFSINGDQKPRSKLFEVVKAITRTRDCVDWVIKKLVAKLDEVKGQGDAEYEFEISDTLLVVLKEVQRLKEFATDVYLDDVFAELLKLVQSVDDGVMECLGDFIKLIVVFADKKKHQKVLDDSIKLFIQDLDILEQQNKLVNIFIKIIAGVDNSVKFENVEGIVNKLITFTETTQFEDTYTKLGYLQLISLLVNKFIENLDPYLIILGSEPTLEKLEIFTWITKAIILKTDSKSTDFINILTTYLTDETIGSQITKSFEILVIDLSIFDKFKKKSNNKVRLLYKQKFFQIITPILVTNFKSTDSLKLKTNHLTALSYILKHTKREIIIPHLTQFFPLLLQALSLPNAEVRYASVNTILSTIDEIPDLVSAHLQTLVPTLLKLSDRTERVNTEDVRLVSLNCLEALTHCVKLEKLVPYQDRILRELAPVLDDPKRKVRKGCVDTRQAFYELGRTVD